MLPAHELKLHIRGCTLNDRKSQKIIYDSFFNYGMAICERYTKRKEDAIEIYNDAFLKIYREIYRFKPAYTDEASSFKGWIKKILIYTAVDHIRKYNKHYFSSDFESSVLYMPAVGENALDMMSYDEIIKAIKFLTPGYRTVLNMFIIDGFSHEEIATQLGISVGTSKSNLFKAREQLKKFFKEDKKKLMNKNVG